MAMASWLITSAKVNPADMVVAIYIRNTIRPPLIF